MEQRGERRGGKGGREELKGKQGGERGGEGRGRGREGENSEDRRGMKVGEVRRKKDCPFSPDLTSKTHSTHERN